MDDLLDGPRPRPASRARCGQRQRPALPDRDCGRRRLHVHRQADRAQRRRPPSRGRAVRLRQSRGRVEGPGELDDPHRADVGPQRRRGLFGQVQGRRCRARKVRHHWRLGRFHRQILADRARPRSGRRLRRPVPQRREHQLPRRLHLPAQGRRAGPPAYPDQPLLRGRQGGEAAPALREPGRAQAGQGDRLGLVRNRREADLHLSRLAVPHGRQFRRRDHPADAHDPRPDVPDRAAPVRLDGQDARHPAAHEGDPGAAQGRQGEACSRK